jgi:hypothetical protein
MNPQIEYIFRSHKGINVTITSRLGEDSARQAAMEHIWGPAYDWCMNVGAGLDLVSAKELVS